MRTDAELVHDSRSGDTSAFEEIVERYQNLLSSIAYSAVGDFSLSEEITHESFVAAWRGLEGLEDPQSLRAWLCGIVRRRTQERIRQRARQEKTVERFGHDQAGREGTSPAPDELAQRRESSVAVWEALESVPELYREPLALFYRMNRSTREVAVALDLSEAIVRQRLSRGRKLLRSKVEPEVARTLSQSVPGKAFATAVCASLLSGGSKVLAASSSAASVATKAGVGSKVLGAGGAGALGGTALGILGGWIGMRATMKQTPSARARRAIGASGMLALLLTVVWALSLPLLIRQAPNLMAQSAWHYPVALVSMILGYQAGLGLILGVGIRRWKKILREEGLWDEETNAPVGVQRVKPLRKRQYIESRKRIWGIPLYCVSNDPKRVAFGWVAMGPVAVGLLMGFGGVSVGLFSMGGLAFGGVALAGCAVGGIAFAGVSVGVLALGGLSAGIWAVGGIAAGLNTAVAGISISSNLAIGGLVQGPSTTTEESAFARWALWMAGNARWAWVFLLPPILMVAVLNYRAVRRAREQESAADDSPDSV